ncbi:hypothetical protein Peur_024154 [Populus x canadensis]
MAGEGEAKSLEETPTWAVATVCFFLILISIFIEHLLHLLAKYFNKKRRKYLIQALYKIKTELMLLGFISLLLTVLEKPVANICIPKSASETFLPCGSVDSSDWSEEEAKCAEQGRYEATPVLDICACFLPLRIKHFYIRPRDGQDPRRFQLSHQTPFGKRHLRYWNENSVLRWPACFLGQFYGSVSKVDYLTLRHGFIMMLLLVGTKLQAIITLMCLDSHDKSLVVEGTILVRPSDHFFWFGRPKLLLHLIHFILFQNSFQLAFFTWTWMGSSMRTAVFTENVVEGLKRWRAKARKNLKISYSARPSLDASVDTSLSLDSSPSFSLSASYSIDPNRPVDSDHVTIEVIDEAKHNDEQPREHKKNGSFEGFSVSNAALAMEKQSGL